MAISIQQKTPSHFIAKYLNYGDRKMSTLTVKILNPKARNILDDLANVGLIEVLPFNSSIEEFQQEMCGVAEKHGLRNEGDIAGIVADIRREMRKEYQPPVEK